MVDVSGRADGPGRESLAHVMLDRAAVEDLFARRLIPPAAREDALAALDPPRRWGLWVARLLTSIGCALILAGIVYFFAFNWNRIPPLDKLAAIGGLWAAAAIGAVVAGPSRPVGQILAVIAIVLVGVFEAVFGQIYQTGADAWGLFALWAAVALPWAVLCNSAAAWAVWLAIANVGVVLWAGQTQPSLEMPDSGALLAPILLDLGFLAAREVLARLGVVFAAPAWTRIFPGIPAIVTAVVALVWLIPRHGDVAPIGLATGVAAAVTVIAVIVVYRALLPDLTMLTAGTIAAGIIGVTICFELLDKASPGSGIAKFFITGAVSVLAFAVAAAWLRQASRHMTRSRRPLP